ncbi:oxidoreductase [Cohnella nanjingensis]|uniref:Oxidoreductase n=1 Tax=Cohnella nanjingensis TaxID=1387779 RepID=A0A7X0RMV6_9BACL|nr:oxidoreductase [Cohnella nanjingensis]MBB6670311.1 oxidoreductase [Cohnella nanjingensis]
MTIAPKTAILAGATGLVGRSLLRRLLADERYGAVVALTRRPLAEGHPKLISLVVNFDELEKRSESLPAAEDWYCALGTTIKQAGSQAAFRAVDHDYPLALGRIAASRGAAQMMIVTAMGANAGSGIFYNRVKGEIERDLGALPLPALRIFRPSLLLGDRAQFRTGERFASVLMRATAPLMIGALRKYRAVHADTVAAAMIAAANAPDAPAGKIVYENDRLPELAAR